MVKMCKLLLGFLAATNFLEQNHWKGDSS